MNVKVKLLSERARVPTYSYETDACFDFYSIENITLYPGTQKLVGTGVAVYFDPGWEMQIRPRSGLSLKGVMIGNSPGTVDHGFTNEILINLVHMGEGLVYIREGDRIAQGALKPIHKVEFEVVEELPETDRGLGGWGSTGE